MSGFVFFFSSSVTSFLNENLTENTLIMLSYLWGPLLNSDILKSELLSNTTIQNHFVKIGTFLDSMAQNGYSDSSLKTPLHGVIKKTKIVSQHRDVFFRG